MARICKVLIVEDHDGVRALLGDIFHDEGYRFALVGSGGEMREALEDEDYDVVIIDVSLRDGESGFTLAEVARQHGCGVVLTTGDHRHADRLQASGYHFLMKPFKVQELVALVDRVLKEIAARCIRRKRRDGTVFPAGQ
ncbi:MAG: response regulator [Alphaproteobacteria bacterium]|nr:response regulator [Alphaproteobacteria bacterium]MBV9861051.1 response regulator [Alphaproteobacteria bacterium]